MKNNILVISGIDSSKGAGQYIDKLVCNAHNIPANYIVSAKTQQSHNKLQQVVPTQKEQFIQQLQDLEKSTFEVVKIGMLPETYQAKAILKHLATKRIIYDPVFVTSSGGNLVQPNVQQYLIEQFIPHVYLLTPNTQEAKQISANELVNQAVLFKGGHSTNSTDKTMAIDILCQPSNLPIQYKTKRIINDGMSKNVRGTGCMLSTAIACNLAIGDNLPSAVSKAKQFVSKAIENAKLANNNKYIWQG